MSGRPGSLKLIHVKSACENCRVRELCLPTSLDGVQLNLMDQLVKRIKPIKKGDYLYHTGDDFKGYVLGLSLPLPVFNRNRPEIENSRIDYESAVFLQNVQIRVAGMYK